MPDDKINLEIGVDVKVTDLDQAKALREEFERLNREILQLSRDLKTAMNPMASLGRARSQLSGTASRGGNAALDAERQTYADLKRRLAFERRMQAQRTREESSAAKRLKDDQADTRRALNDQLNFSMRMMRERARAEADAERTTRREIEATAKARDKANRKAISDAKDLERAQAKAAGRAARGAGQIRDGVGRVAGTAAATGAVAGYGLERAVDRGVSTRMDVDSAETALKIFGDMPDGRGGKRAITAQDIRNLRRGPDGLDNLAVGTGTSITDALKAYAEAAKAGLIDPMGQTKNILTAGNGLELDPTRTTKLLGTMARNMGAGATPERLKRTLNAIAIGAREDPTQSNEIVEGLNRAQGVLSMSSGITEEDLVALVSGGQSVGIQPGKAGTTITALARSILEGGNKFIDPKKRKELNFASRKLGFGSAMDMAAKFAGNDGKSVLYQIIGNLKNMPAQLRQQVADALSGGQWADEDLQIVNGIDGMKATDREINDPKNAGFLDEANAKKMQSWQGLWSQSKTIFSLFWERYGKMDYDRISGYVRDALDGLRQGLGFDSWKEALGSLVPSSGAGDIGKKIGEFARGFASSIRQIGAAISSFSGMFGSSNAGAENIGRLAGQFVTLGIAGLALAPVLGILGGVSTFILGLANVARAAASVLGMGAGVAGGGAVAGALASVARILSGGFIVSLAGAIGDMRGEISTLILDAVRPMVSALWEGLKRAFTLDGLKAGGKAVIDELIPAPLQRWLNGGAPAGSNDGTTPEAHATGGYITGPGGPRSDSIMARLSNGEFVVNAAAASEHRGLLEAINGGAPGYALGGVVGQQAGSAAWSPFHDSETRSLTQAIQDLVRTLKKDQTDRTFGIAGRRKHSNNGGWTKEAAEAYARGQGGIPGEAVGRSIPGEAVNRGIRGHAARLRGSVGGGGSSTPAPDGQSDPIPGALNPRLAGSRKSLMDELDRDPALRRDVLKTASMENRGSPAKMQTVLESMVNRAKMNGYSSLRQAVHSGFYGPVNRGGLRGALSEKDRSDGEKALAQVKAGSNAIGYRTDQGMLTDPGARRYMREADHSGHRVIAGENYFYMGRKGRQWAKQQEALDARQGSGDVAQRVAADTRRTQGLGTSLSKPNLGDLDIGPQNGLGARAPLGASVPIRPTPSGLAGGGQGGGAVTNHVTVNGSNLSPTEMAGAVQRALQDSMNRRTHDYDGFA